MRPCILVVDDDVGVASLLCEHLEQQGYRVTYCNDAAQALIQAEGMKLGLVIADIMMPVYGSGVDVYKRIRSNPRFPRNLPIIFLTGINPEQARRMVPVQDLYVRLMFKPTTLAKLTQVIQELTGGRLLEARPGPKPAHPAK
jgi:CheY-like chemotaxis protein